MNNSNTHHEVLAVESQGGALARILIKHAARRAALSTEFGYDQYGSSYETRLTLAILLDGAGQYAMEIARKAYDEKTGVDGAFNGRLPLLRATMCHQARRVVSL